MDRSHGGTVEAEQRAAVLAGCGANAAEQAELADYVGTSFAPAPGDAALTLPLTDEPCVATWQAYVQEADADGAWATLVRHLPRLRFPVRAGMSGNADYRAATLRGQATTGTAADGALTLREPGALTLTLHATAAGRIPIIVAGCRADFVTLVQALVHRNEPWPVPASMGAALVSGSNNWERVAAYRAAWRARGGAPGAAAWAAEFAHLRTCPEHYQDRFMILQPGCYSAVAAATLGLDPTHWRRLSLQIRREHECTHYFTLRVLGAMRNHLLDELIADYAGIVAACGRFRADWFMVFLGIAAADRYRRGGRLENYRGEPPLTAGAMRVLQRVLRQAALAVADFDTRHARARAAPGGQARMLLALAAQDLASLAGPQASACLEAAWQAVAVRWTGAP